MTATFRPFYNTRLILEKSIYFRRENTDVPKIRRPENVKRGRGRPTLTWTEAVKRDLKEWNIDKELAADSVGDLRRPKVLKNRI
jgi:hypothetical protein